MPSVNLPLSGAVSQAFKAWTSMFSAFGSQIGLINVNVGTSSNPAIEEEILSDVGSYGRQLGRIADAMIVLLRCLPPELPEDERRAITDLKSMLNEIANVKEKHGAKHVLRPPA
jgi:hypothetical protein